MQSNTEVLSELYVCGNAQFGQLGLGVEYKEKNYKLPKICSYSLIITKISCGGQHSCFVTEKGHVYSMGSNEFGQLGIGNSNINYVAQPTLIQSLSEQQCTSLKTGTNHTIALTNTTEIYSWGQGYFGALGTGYRSNNYAPKKIKLQQDSVIIKISCGDRHSAFVTSKGALLMTGSNESGQCGMLGQVELLIPTQISLTSIKKNSNVKKVSCGYSHTLILTQSSLDEEQQLYSFGCNQFGQLGLGKEYIGGSQIKLVNLTNVIKIRASNFSVALTKLSELYIWGCTVLGEFYTPTKISVPKNVQLKSISLGASFGCLLDINGGIYTWGKNNSGELALGDEQPRNQVLQVNSLKKKHIKKIQCGANFLMCLSGQQQKDKDKTLSKDQNRLPKGILKKRNTNDTINNLIIKTEDEEALEEIESSQQISQKQTIQKRSYSFDSNKSSSIYRLNDDRISKFSQANQSQSTPSTQILDKEIFLEAEYIQNQELLQELKLLQRQNQILHEDILDLQNKNKDLTKMLIQKDDQIRDHESQHSTIERKSSSIDRPKENQIFQLQAQNQKLIERITMIIDEKIIVDNNLIEMQKKVNLLEVEKQDYKCLLQTTEDEFQLNLDKLENCLTRLDQKQIQIIQQKGVIDQLKNNNEEIRKRQLMTRDIQDQKNTLEQNCINFEDKVNKLEGQLKIQEEKNQYLIKLLDSKIAHKTEEFRLDTFSKVKLDSLQDTRQTNQNLNLRYGKLDKAPGRERNVSVDDLLEKQRQIIDNSANKLRDYLNQKKNQIMMIDIDTSNRQAILDFDS